MYLKHVIGAAGIATLLASCSETGDAENQQGRVGVIQQAVEETSPTRLKLKVGVHPTPFDADSTWQDFVANEPGIRAWALGRRLDKLRSPNGLIADGWQAEHDQALGASTLAELWPAPRVTKTDACEASENDCDAENPYSYDIADRSESVKTKVTDLLWRHVQLFVEQHSFLGVSAYSVTSGSKPLRVVRARTGFEMEVERNAGGFPVFGGPQLIRFNSEGHLMGFNKGFVVDSEHEDAERLGTEAVDQASIIEQAQSYIENTGITEDGVVPTHPDSVRRVFDAVRGRVIDVVRLGDLEGNSPPCANNS